MSTNNGAQFQFYLNRQGPIGPSGPEGPQGFSPIIEPIENEDGTWRLKITNNTGVLYSENIQKPINWEDLKSPVIIKGENRYHYETNTEFTADGKIVLRDNGIADPTNTITNTGITLNDPTNNKTLVLTSYTIQLNGKPVALYEHVTELRTDLESSISQLDSRITTNYDEINSLTVDLDATNTNVNGLQEVVSSHSTTLESLQTDLNNKQDKLIPGDNITIEGNVISSTGGGITNIPIASPTQLGGVKIGENLTITSDGVLNAQAGGSGGPEYVAGQNITIDEETHVIAATGTLSTDLIDGGDSLSAYSEPNGAPDMIANSGISAKAIGRSGKIDIRIT